jgi:hypothetical protein
VVVTMALAELASLVVVTGSAATGTRCPVEVSTVPVSGPLLPLPPPPLPFTVGSKRRYSRRSPPTSGSNRTRSNRASRPGSVTSSVTIRYLPLSAVVVTRQLIPVGSSAGRWSMSHLASPGRHNHGLRRIPPDQG